MRYLLYFVFCLILLPITCFSQKEKRDTIQPFLYLQDGLLLKQNEFKVKGGLLGKKFLYQNGDKINFQDIKFYQSTKEYYANYYGRFAIRKETGRFDLFTFIERSSYPTSTGYTSVSVKKYVYAKGFGDLKGLSYDNLKSDFSVFPNNDHPQEEKIILDLLEKGKKRKKTKKVILLYGVSAFVVGTVFTGLAIRPDDSGVTTLRNKGLAVAGLSLCVGGVGAWTTSFVLPKDSKFYLESFRTYNRVY